MCGVPGRFEPGGRAPCATDGPPGPPWSPRPPQPASRGSDRGRPAGVASPPTASTCVVPGRVGRERGPGAGGGEAVKEPGTHLAGHRPRRDAGAGASSAPGGNCNCSVTALGPSLLPWSPTSVHTFTGLGERYYMVPTCRD